MISKIPSVIGKDSFLYKCIEGTLTVSDPNSYRRKPLVNRPWILGKLYDDLTRPGILHMDAYVFTFGGNKYLQLDWRVRGVAPLALDTWLIEPDGLTPVWDMARERGACIYERDAALHARVIQQAREAQATDRWARVSVLCHYIDARERDVEKGLGHATPRTRSKPPAYEGKLPDIL